MNRFFTLLLLLLPLLGSATEKSLSKRVSFIDKESFIIAVNDIEKKIPQKLKTHKGWEDALDQLTADKKALCAAIESGDKNAISKAEKLLVVLDKTLLANPMIADKKVLVTRRVFGDKSRSVMGGGLGIAPSNFQNNSEIGNPEGSWNNQFVEYSDFAGKLKSEVVYTPKEGVIISDPELHFSGEKLMFSSIGTENRWHLFELDIKSGNVQQITPDDYLDFDSFDGCYTPDGRYIFCATATFLGLPCTDGGNKMCGMFSYDPKTKRTRQLTFDQDSNWDPVILNNGQVMYQRWEYADIPHSNSRIMFTMNPDGTSQMAYYGTNSYFPTAFFGARPIPGHPTAIVGTASGHHSVSRSGRLFILDPALGTKEAEGVVAEIPRRGKKVNPVVRDRFPDGLWPQFLHPYPLNDKYFVVSMKPDPKSLWGIYLVDTFNNMTLIVEDENAAMLEPVLIDKRNTPPVIPDRINLDSKTATIFLQDVYFGDGLKGVKKGEVKKLRVGSYSFSPLNQGGLLGTIGMDGPWDVKRILGEVEVEEDGSAMFTIPANTPIFIQPLDSDGKALQLMRSWFTAMPGETLSCIGCHENRNSVPVPKAVMASKKQPQQIKEFYGKERGFSFKHEIQPILDRSCVACHNGSKPNRPYFKGDSMLNDWSSQISGHGDRSYAGHFSESYAALHRYVRRPGIESDIDMLVPMDVHADQTELIQMLSKGHHGVKLDKESLDKLMCWIDFNSPYHGRRKDIPSYKRTKWAYETRAKYLNMLGIDHVDLEWLPELPQAITPVLPEKRQPTEQGVDSLKGWPYFNPVKTKNRQAWEQVNLGYFQTKIELSDGVWMDLVKVPSGKFIMGGTTGDEIPRTTQKIEEPFWIGRFEVTNEQFAQFKAEHNSRTEHRHGYQFGREGYPLNKPDQPVVRVSWEEAMAFCEWLSEKTGLKITLPTEQEWEWACRAGSDTPYSFGDYGANFSRHANLGDIRLRDFAACTAFKSYEGASLIENPSRYDDWIPRDTTYDDAGFVSEQVGRYISNPWDLYDMHGNVWEWTLSKYKSYPYNDNDGRNDTDLSSDKRVARGGSWYDRPFKATSSFRTPYREYQKVFNVGFRVVVHNDQIDPN